MTHERRFEAAVGGIQGDSRFNILRAEGCIPLVIDALGRPDILFLGKDGVMLPGHDCRLDDF
jgi:hypothetical protein